MEVKLRKVLAFNSSKTTTTLHNNVKDMERPVHCKEQQHVVFLKIHKSGSTTLIGTFQKFAYTKKLQMMVPSTNNNMFDWPLEFQPNKDNVENPNNEKFDMLVNHIVFNKTSISSLMKPDTKYVTILREPLPHLRSSFQYFELNLKKRIADTGPEAIERFLMNPWKFDFIPDWLENIIPYAANRINSVTRNLQSADLGLSYWKFDDQSAVDKFVDKTMSDFDFIMVLERLDESLAVLRRIMCWEMKDVMYIPKNINPKRSFEVTQLTEQAIHNVYKWNNVDTKLYDRANRQLDVHLGRYPDIKDEVAQYKKFHLTIAEFCLHQHTRNRSITIPGSRWNSPFVVDNEYCVLLQMDERDLTHAFKCKQYPKHKGCFGKDGERVRKVYSMIEGAIEYQYMDFPQNKTDT